MMIDDKSAPLFRIEPLGVEFGASPGWGVPRASPGHWRQMMKMSKKQISW